MRERDAMSPTADIHLETFSFSDRTMNNGTLNDREIIIAISLSNDSFSSDYKPFSTWLPMAVTSSTFIFSLFLVYSSTLVTAGMYLIIRC